MLDDVGEKLPKVTNEDNGKILAVTEGVWDKVEPNGGNESVVTFSISYDPLDYNNYICDKTYDELATAIRAKKILLGCFYTDSTYYTFTHINASSDDGYIVCWVGLQYESMSYLEENTWGNMYTYFFINSDNTISHGPSLYIDDGRLVI